MHFFRETDQYMCLCEKLEGFEPGSGLTNSHVLCLAFLCIHHLVEGLKFTDVSETSVAQVEPLMESKVSFLSKWSSRV